MSARLDPGMVGPTLRSWQLRCVLALACCVTAAATVLWTEPNAFALVLLALVAVATVVRPDSHAATFYLGLTAFLVLVNEPGMSWWAAPAVLGIHATHTLAALAAVVPWDTAVERAALRPSVRRFVAVQAASQSLVLLALAVTP
ncbi:hypothetical protein G1H11_23125 [Phytoactinopolyspora alkaliphila]|uniref:Uncharacterized protein n=1 Tax=Phytoactinopolyspora alkaliphila TaxID=1783498 RepID=A0A6N9YTE4_9ACTN|nr:hypothetical protein [Phytoactinopolyspora alkaliphila]NED98197.1 hypothetical protein [Phytoactinopolyspora alkaliphila]